MALWYSGFCADAAWAEEAGLRGLVEAGSETYKQQFWSRLEDEWREAAEDGSHHWLDELPASHEPFAEYKEPFNIHDKQTEKIFLKTSNEHICPGWAL